MIAFPGGVAADPAETYAKHCASCHGERRYGGYAPPLIPQSLGRKSDADLRKTLLEGRPNTQMPGFAALLDAPAADAMVAFMREPAGEIRWTLADMAASRSVTPEAPGATPAIPPGIDRENLILVVERGTGSMVVLDGNTLRELDRFETGRVHGGPKFDRALRRVYAVTRDGTVFDYDLARGGLRGKVKVAVNTRNIALSPDGSLLAAANQLPRSLTLLDADLGPLAILPLPGQPSGVYQVPGEPRFMLTLRDAPLLLFLPYAGEREFRRVELPEPFEDFTFVPGRTEILASSREGRRIHLYDYRQGHVRASLDTEALPHLFSACFFSQGERRLAALNHIGLPRLSIVDLDSFEVVREIELAGSGYFVRTHPGTPYLWADTNSEQLQLVDKRTLEPARTLVPAPGKKAMHVEFTKDGGRALVSVWDPEGAVVVYDSRSLEETARLPYAMPIGKYNAWNKTTLLR